MRVTDTPGTLVHAKYGAGCCDPSMQLCRRGDPIGVEAAFAGGVAAVSSGGTPSVGTWNERG